MPNEAPEHPDDWRQVIPDIEEKIMPGVCSFPVLIYWCNSKCEYFKLMFQITHWGSPMFNAYFPAGHSYPSVIGDLICSGIGCIGFNWVRTF